MAFKGVHFGCAPWLRPNGLDWNNPRNVQNSLEDCEAQCRSIKGCKYGTYMEHGERRGECWLAAQTSLQETQCGSVLGNNVEVCTGFHLNADVQYGQLPAPPAESEDWTHHIECEADHYYLGVFKSQPLCVTCTVGKFSPGCGPPPKQVCHEDRYGSACERLSNTIPNLVMAHMQRNNSDDSTREHCEISSSYGDWSKCSQECNLGKKYRYKEIQRYSGVCGASSIRSHTIIQTAPCNDRPCSSKEEAETVRYRHVTVPAIRLIAALPTDKEHTSVVGMADSDEELASLGEPTDSHIGPGTAFTVTNMQEPAA